jgi:hypothetical protein
LIADLASEIQIIRLFHNRSNDLFCLANVTSPQMKQKLSALLTQLRGIANARLTLLGSLCGINDAGVNGCRVYDGLMQYDAIQGTGKAKSQVEAEFYR